MKSNFVKQLPPRQTSVTQRDIRTTGLLALGLTLLTVLSSWPFLVNDALPADNDAELHIYRIAEMGYSLDAGVFYPRWAPDFYHGYGYPIFNYYAPLTYHLGYWITFGRPELAVQAAKLLFIGAQLLGVVGTYKLGKAFGGQGGGLLGSVAFAFSPYIQFVNPHVRGDLAEVFALGCLPWVLWSWHKLWQGRELRFGILAVVSAAATLLSHNLTGLTMLGLIGGLSAWHLLISGHRSSLRNALLVGVTFVLVTGFFWLPFLIERPYIQLEDVAGQGHYDYRQHFVTLPELLSLLPQQDYRAIAPMAPMTVGPQILALAVAGFVVSLFASVRSRRELITFARSDRMFFVFSALFTLWLIHRSSAWVWGNIPGFVYFQFPWRFLGPLAVLFVPLIAGMGCLPWARTRGWLLALGVGGLILTGLPGLYPRPWSSDWGRIDRLGIIQAELTDRWRGTTSTNDFVPRSVQMIPGPEKSVLASYHNPPIDRVNRHTLPEGTSVQIVSDGPQINRFRVNGTEAFALRLYLFDFPGWTAYVDGKKTPIELAKPEGFITVDVPAGQHEVVVRFESTPARRAGWLLAWSGTVIGLIGMPKLYRESPFPERAPEPEQRKLVRVITAIIGAFLVANGFLFDSYGWFRYTSELGKARPAETTQYATFGNQSGDEEIKLLGYNLSHKETSPSRTLNVTLYWMAARPMTQTYQSFVHIVGPEGKLWTQSDHLNPAGFPTDRWPLDRYIRDRHQLTLNPELPSGSYEIQAGLYILEEDRRLQTLDPSGNDTGTAVILSRRLSVTP